MTTIQTPITVGCSVAHHFQCQCIIWIHVEHIVMAFKFERRFCQICNLSPWLQATKVVQMHINLAIPPETPGSNIGGIVVPVGQVRAPYIPKIYTSSRPAGRTYKAFFWLQCTTNSLHGTPALKATVLWCIFPMLKRVLPKNCGFSCRRWFPFGFERLQPQGTPMKPPNQLQVMLQALGLEHLPAIGRQQVIGCLVSEVGILKNDEKLWEEYYTIQKSSVVSIKKKITRMMLRATSSKEGIIFQSPCFQVL